jgi:hypothetical protein
MIDKRLIESGYISIPLKKNDTTQLNPQPNWFIIEDVFGKKLENLPVLGETVCGHSSYKIVFREILPESIELGRNEDVREVPFEKGYQMLPLNIIPALATHETLYQYRAQVNYLFSLFQFRGVLEGFKLEIDEILLLDIITPEPTPSATPEPTPEPTPSATPEPTPSATPEPTPEPTPSATPEPN